MIDHKALAELLHDIGWRSSCDAQWEHLKDAIPQIRDMVAPDGVVGAKITVKGNKWNMDYLSLPEGTHTLYLRGVAFSAPDAQQAQTAPVVPEVHLPDRVIDTLISTAGVSTFHPDGSQREKLHSLVHGVAAEVLARLPLSAAPSAPIQANGEDAHYKQQRDRLLDFIKHAPVSSGVCCCGDSMTNHASPMTCGHGPVDQWDHSVSCIVRDIEEDDAAIAATAQQKEGE